MIDTIHFQLFLATFAGWVGRREASVIAYLIEENRVLKEQLEAGGRHLRFTDGQRRTLAAKGKPLGRKVLSQIATIVTPDTILAWQRRLIASNAKVLKEHGIKLSPDRPLGWATFVRSHAHLIAAADFFTTEVRTVRGPVRCFAYAERFVRSITSECLDQMIFVGRESLVRAIAEYTAHYHDERSHRGIGNVLISGAKAQGEGVGNRERLYGLLKYYYRQAA